MEKKEKKFIVIVCTVIIILMNFVNINQSARIMRLETQVKIYTELVDMYFKG